MFDRTRRADAAAKQLKVKGQHGEWFNIFCGAYGAGTRNGYLQGDAVILLGRVIE